MHLRNLKEKHEEYGKRGSMKAICHNLEIASEKGLLKDKTALRDFLITISKNQHAKKRGKRYKPTLQSVSLKLFLSVGVVPDWLYLLHQICLVLRCTNFIGGAIVTALHWKVE